MGEQTLQERLREPIPHNYCEDGWYSCPKATDGCSDANAGDECNCGSTYFNAERAEAATRLDEFAATVVKYESLLSEGTRWKPARWWKLRRRRKEKMPAFRKTKRPVPKREHWDGLIQAIRSLLDEPEMCIEIDPPNGKTLAQTARNVRAVMGRALLDGDHGFHTERDDEAKCFRVWYDEGTLVVSRRR